MLNRRGHTLAELLVALTLAAIVLASATGTLLRQQRTAADLTTLGRSTAQLRTATALVPAQLSLLAPSVADIAPGEASDTALQLRVAVATGVACSGADPITFSVDTVGTPSGGYASLPRSGDSLWWYAPDSSRWLGTVLTDAWRDSLPCTASDVGPAGPVGALRSVVRVRVADAAVVAATAPLRITRQLRFSVYKSGDGTWQLGLREWSDALGALSAPQPVAGPFQRLAADGARSGFRYFDASGSELAPGGDPAAQGRIARLRVTLVGVQAAYATRPPQRDSADVAFAP